MATLKCISEEDLEALLQAEGLETVSIFTPTTSGSFTKMATYSKISTVCANTFSDSSGNTYTVSFTADSNDTSTDDNSLASGTLSITATLIESEEEETEGTLLYVMTYTDGSEAYYYSNNTVVDEDGNTTKLSINLNSRLDCGSTNNGDTTLKTLVVYAASPGELSASELISYDSLGSSRSGMFEGDTSLTTVNFTGLDWDSINYMYNTFFGCSSLTSVYNGSGSKGTINGSTVSVNYLDMSNIKDMGKESSYSSNIYSRCYVFDGCTSLKDLYLYHFTPDNSDYEGIDLYLGDSPLTYNSAKYLIENMQFNSSTLSNYYSSTLVFSATTGSYLSASEIGDIVSTTPISIYIASKDGPDSTEKGDSQDNRYYHVEDYSWGLNYIDSYKMDGALWQEDSTYYNGDVNTSSTFSGYTVVQNETSNGYYPVRFNNESGVAWTYASTASKYIYYGGVYLQYKDNFLNGVSNITYLDLTGVTLINSISEWETAHDTTGGQTSDYDLSMSYMFANCTSLEYVNICTWETSLITDMGYMFYNDTALTTIHFNWYADSSSFSTKSVTTMYYMFSNCSALVSLDLSNFATSNVTDMRHMFDGCSKLKTVTTSSNGLDMSGITENETYTEGMFTGCSSLTSIKLSGLSGANELDMHECPLDSTSAIFIMNNIGTNDDYGQLIFSETTYNNLGGSSLTSSAKSALANVISQGWAEVAFLDSNGDVVYYYPE